MRTLVPIASLLALAVAWTPLGAQEVLPDTGMLAGETVFVVDWKAHKLAEIDGSTGTLRRTLDLGAEPGGLAQTPDGSRLLVPFIPPTGHEGQAVLAIIDTESLKVQSKVTLGWGWPNWRYDGYGTEMEMGFDGVVIAPNGTRMYCVCPGRDDKNPAKSKPAELFAVDLQAGAVVGRAAFELPSLPSWQQAALLAVGDRTVVYVPNSGSGKNLLRAKLLFADLTQGKVTAQLVLDGDVKSWVLAPDGTRAYFLSESGTGEEKPNRGEGLEVQVVSLAEARLEARLAACPYTLWMLADQATGQVLLVGSAGVGKDRKGSPGQLRFIRGAELVATTSVASSPSLVRRIPGGTELIVVGVGELSVVDVAAGTARATFSFRLSGNRSTSAHPSAAVVDAAVTPDGRTALVLCGQTTKLEVIDLKERTVRATIATGRTSSAKVRVAFADPHTTASEIATHINSARRALRNRTLDTPADLGADRFVPAYDSATLRPEMPEASEWGTPAPPLSFLFLDADGTHAYAYSYAMPTSMTIVDVASGTIVDVVGFSLDDDLAAWLGPQASHIAQVHNASIDVLETATGKASSTALRHGAGLTRQVFDQAVSPDRLHTALTALENVFIVDIAGGPDVKVVKGFKGARWVAFRNRPAVPSGARSDSPDKDQR